MARPRNKHGIDAATYRNTMGLYVRRGVSVKNSVLTDEIVKQIRADRTRSAAQWASELGCHRRTIEAVRMYETWKHVKD